MIERVETHDGHNELNSVVTLNFEVTPFLNQTGFCKSKPIVIIYKRKALQYKSKP